jgi:hypothetical protein
MQITRAIFDEIAPGEIFRVVTTRLQNFQDSMTKTLTFVCLKDKSGCDWVIYAGNAGAHPADIARYGAKVSDKQNIQSICPCDEEVMELYRK